MGDARSAADVTRLRTARLHLTAQVSTGRDTRYGMLAEAQEALAKVEAELREAEEVAREYPTNAYLFGRPKRSAGRTRVPMPQSADTSNTTPKEGTPMAKLSAKQVKQMEEIQVALRKAEKSAGSTKWALSGKGAEANPPDAKKKRHLKEKLANEQARVAELRAQRDALKA